MPGVAALENPLGKPFFFGKSRGERLTVGALVYLEPPQLEGSVHRYGEGAGRAPPGRVPAGRALGPGLATAGPSAFAFCLDRQKPGLRPSIRIPEVFEGLQAEGVAVGQADGFPDDDGWNFVFVFKMVARKRIFRNG